MVTENTFFSRWSQRKLTAESDQALDTTKSSDPQPVQAEPIESESVVETESGSEVDALEPPLLAENENPVWRVCWYPMLRKTEESGIA